MFNSHTDNSKKLQRSYENFDLDVREFLPDQFFNENLHRVNNPKFSSSSFQDYSSVPREMFKFPSLTKMEMSRLMDIPSDLYTPPATQCNSRTDLRNSNSPTLSSYSDRSSRCQQFSPKFSFSAEFRDRHSETEYRQLVCAALMNDELGGPRASFAPRIIDSRTPHLKNAENVFSAEYVHDKVKGNRVPGQDRFVSNKVFVGGISNTMNRDLINRFFGQFGPVFVDWPVKVPKNKYPGKPVQFSSYSYLFLVYVNEESVHRLMESCQRPKNNEFYIELPGYKSNMIQIRPWFLQNAFYIMPGTEHKKVVDIHRTVFVGGLPRIVTAYEIALMFSQFGRVLLVTIDIDQDYGYPKGAARVTFEMDSSFNKALDQKYLKFDDIDSSKTVIEIKPYVMEDVGCDQCGGLWFNPFLDIFEHLQDSYKRNKEMKAQKATNKHFNIWNYDAPFSTRHDESEDLERNFQNVTSVDKEDEIRDGCEKFLGVARKFGLQKEKTVTLNGREFSIGPDLWACFVVPPILGPSPVTEMQVDQQIQSKLTMKIRHVYGNKSSYCKHRPCRQYYCASCSHKIHSELKDNKPHALLPGGKQERRPRKDKDMYLVA